jgi:rhamnulokinase
MPETIALLCRERGQRPPTTQGSTIRCVLESLALRYRQVLGSLEQLTGNEIGTIHVVGGGSQNELLNQMTADACGRHLIAGPIEATALGNVLVQCMAAGEVSSLWQARAIVRDSFPLKVYEPEPSAAWDDAAARFDRLSAG